MGPNNVYWHLLVVKSASLELQLMHCTVCRLRGVLVMRLATIVLQYRNTNLSIRRIKRRICVPAMTTLRTI
jgi:hypothetical protein